VLHQRLGFARHAAPLQIRRRGVQADRKRRHLTRCQRGVVGQAAHAQREVEVLADQVDAARRQVELEGDRRVLFDEIGEQPAEHDGREVGRHRYPQPPARQHLALLRERAGGLDFGRDLVRVLEHAVTEVCDRQLACRAKQQALAELRFQRRDAPRHGRFGQPDTLRGAAETALVGDPREEHQVVRFQVHRCSSLSHQ
jgi:hypothetical protein